MNIKHKLSIFAASLLLAACSSESVIDSPVTPENPGPADDANRREVLLTLKNDLRLKQYPRAARAAGDPIATEEENYIQSLDVYVFGAKEEAGPYTFQELHYFRDDASEVNVNGVNAYSFNLNNTSDNTTTGLLKLNKGLYVKLYCVANRTHLYQTAGDGTISEFTDFKSLAQTAPGQDGNQVTVGVPTESDFKTFHTRLIDPAGNTEDDVLTCPLPMTGAYTTPLDLTDFGTSARTQISFKLSRMVARFDVVNDSKTSKFTIEKISMGNGQSAAQFFPIQTLVTDPADLISYPQRVILPDTQKDPANYVGDPGADLFTSTTKGAFYTWPSPQADKGYLVLKGKYAVNQSENKEVTYRVPFQQMVNGVGSYIEVAYNHRYTIAITKADEYHLDFTLKVADWDEGEPVDEYEPENSFDRNSPVTLTAADSQGAYVLDNGQVEVLADAGSKFAFEMGSNTALEETLVYKDASEKWIVEDATARGRAASMTTKYAYKVDDTKLANPAKLLPVIIRLTNPASGTRKEIKVVPAPGPAVRMADAGNSKYVTFDELTNTATLYNLNNQSVKLIVTATTRSDRAEVPTLTTGSSVSIAGGWLVSDAPSADTAEGEYVLTMATAQDALPASTTADFTATASTAKTTVTVKLKDPAMEKLAAKDFVMGSNQMDISGGTAGAPKATLTGIRDNSFTFTVTSPEGVSAEATGGDSWLDVSVSPGANLVNGQKTTVITARIKDATDMGTTTKSDGVITITNPVDGKTAVVEVYTSLPAGPVLSMTEETGNPSSYDVSATTATLYNAAGQYITLSASENCKVTTSDSWLTVDGDNSSSHIIRINAAQVSTATTGTLTFTNGSQGITTVTVVLKDPAITALATGDFKVTAGKDIAFAVASDPANAKVTMTDPTEKNAFTLSVKSPNGISVDEVNTSSWLVVKKTAEGDVTGGKQATVTVSIVAGTDLSAAITNGKIVLKNAIENGGDMTIDVVTEITPVVPAP